MKIASTLIFLTLYFGLSAQTHKPKDFYVRKSGDTVFGIRMVTTAFSGQFIKKPTGEKLELNPDSIQSYSLYSENPNFKRSDPYYFYASTWISVGDSFYRAYYRDSGKVSVLSRDGGINVSIPGAGSSNTGVFYFDNHGHLSEAFLPTAFYKTAKEFFADCPSINDLLDNVPNERNKDKTHKATLQDAAFIVSKYNECISGKK